MLCCDKFKGAFHFMQHHFEFGSNNTELTRKLVNLFNSVLKLHQINSSKNDSQFCQMSANIKGK